MNYIFLEIIAKIFNLFNLIINRMEVKLCKKEIDGLKF